MPLRNMAVYRERMAGVSEKVVSRIASMDADSILTPSAQVQKIDTVARAAGIEAAKGKFVIMGDSDESSDFSALTLFIEKLREGYDLVMGNRFRGGIATGAMPPRQFALSEVSRARSEAS